MAKSNKSYQAKKEELSQREQPSKKTYGQVVRNFGMLPPAYMTASTPGPMKGGAPMYLGKQFTHGVMW